MYITWMCLKVWTLNRPVFCFFSVADWRTCCLNCNLSIRKNGTQQITTWGYQLVLLPCKFFFEAFVWSELFSLQNSQASIFKSNDLQDVHWNQLETTAPRRTPGLQWGRWNCGMGLCSVNILDEEDIRN